MRRKRRFRWLGAPERSIEEIVSEDGPMRPGEVLWVIDRLCGLSGDQSAEKEKKREICIHPKNIFLNLNGDIRMEEMTVQLSAIEPYLPPELTQADHSAPDAAVYALGILMLYMSTGKAVKEEVDTESVSRLLRNLMTRCTAFDPKKRFPDAKALRATIRYETGARKKMRIALVALLFAALAGALVFFSGRTGYMRGTAEGEETGYSSGYTEGFEQGFTDAPGIVLKSALPDAHDGNLSGNYFTKNGPLSAFDGKDVYYLTGVSLYRMDMYTKETRKLADVSGVYALQYYDGMLWYCTESNVFRMDPETGEAETVCESGGMRFYIFDDTLYLYDQTGTQYLYRVDPAKGTLIQVNGAASYHCLNIVEGQLYYISPDKGMSLCRSNPDGSNESIISSGVYETMCVHDGSIYVVTEDGMLRMDLNGGNPERVISHTVCDPNVSDGGIYYISGQGRTLEWMSLDGKTRFTVVTTKTGAFNVAGQWIFYQNDDDGGRLWRVHIGGTNNTRVTQ
ncbi:MAG: DUF5050 domain-containing protein [Lachnospiraceae bacterium]|nr:DUF5050 domain-containing protein [Lachnospiraceae bacterium]